MNTQTSTPAAATSQHPDHMVASARLEPHGPVAFAAALKAHDCVVKALVQHHKALQDSEELEHLRLRFAKRVIAAAAVASAELALLIRTGA